MTAKAKGLTSKKLTCDVVWTGNLLLEIFLRDERNENIFRDACNN